MTLWQDLTFAIRLLIKDRWFTAAAVTALALGIGLTLVAISAIMIVVAVAASLKPVQRATQLDPVVALRYE